MTALAIPNTIDNDTAADAVEVEQNYQVIQSYINTNVIRTDGSTAMAAPLLLVGDPSADNHAATKSYVDAILPVGVILPYGGVAAPAGRWALANGASVATATYPQLYAVFGYRYGGSGGSFLLPNFSARIPVGVDTTQVRFDATGKTGGSYTVTLPAHTHTGPSHTHTGPSHTHEHPHTHPIDHDHANFSAPVGGTITTTIRQNSTAGATGSLMTASATGTSTTQTSNPDLSLSASVNVPSYDGTSGAASDATTGAAGTGDTGASGTAATGSTGTASAEHLQPYVVVQYIVRLD